MRPLRRAYIEGATRAFLFCIAQFCVILGGGPWFWRLLTAFVLGFKPLKLTEKCLCQISYTASIAQVHIYLWREHALLTRLNPVVYPLQPPRRAFFVFHQPAKPKI